MSVPFARLHRILVGIDLASDAAPLIERLVRLPLEPNARVTLVSVLARDEVTAGKEQGITLLHGLAASVIARHPAVAVDVRVPRGHVVGHLAQCVSEDRPDLMLLGASRGGGSLLRSLVAPTAERVARRSSAAVLVVNGSPRSRYRTVVVGVESAGESGRAALASAQRLIDSGSEGEVNVVHMIDRRIERRMGNAGAPRAAIDLTMGWLRERLRREIHQDAAELGGATSLHLHLEDHGHPAEAILSLARRSLADLIVIGADRRWIGADVRLGSVAGTVLRRSGIDVLLVAGRSIGSAHDRASVAAA